MTSVSNLNKTRKDLLEKLDKLNKKLLKGVSVEQAQKLAVELEKLEKKYKQVNDQIKEEKEEKELDKWVKDEETDDEISQELKKMKKEMGLE